MADSPQRTPLYDFHVKMGGRMVDFAGWSLPVQFVGIKEEHIHTRTACSVFDVSHMGRLKLTGGDCQSLLDRLCTRNLSGAEVGRSYYTHMCNEAGGVLDDLIVSRFEEMWGIVCNASNHAKIVAWIERQAAGMDVTLRDETTQTAMIAIQGPRTMDLVQELAGKDISTLKRYRFRSFDIMGMPIVVYRCGYTGEDGLEVVVPAGIVGMVLPRLLGSEKKPHPVIKPAGLGSRDTLRIEASMPLYGHELSEEIDSLSAGQGWCVDLEKDFIGADAMRKLKSEGLSRKLVGLELDGRRIARQDHPVLSGDNVVGKITSGTLGPTVEKSVAMAMIAVEHANLGRTVEVDLGRQRIAATVVELPFYKRSK